MVELILHFKVHLRVPFKEQSKMHKKVAKGIHLTLHLNVHLTENLLVELRMPLMVHLKAHLKAYLEIYIKLYKKMPLRFKETVREGRGRSGLKRNHFFSKYIQGRLGIILFFLFQRRYFIDDALNKKTASQTFLSLVDSVNMQHICIR